MVYGNRIIQETSGKFCTETGNDHGNKTPHNGNGNSDHGHWIPLHEKCACWKNLSDCGLGLPCVILFPESKNRKTGKRNTGRCINNMNKVEKKRQREQYVVEEMIQLYCRKNHSKEERQGRQMCPVCQELSDYAKLRSQKCPFMEQKTFCANCKVHCYKPEKREQIRQVMRFSGPRMILYHPILAVWHLISSKKEKRNL